MRFEEKMMTKVAGFVTKNYKLILLAGIVLFVLSIMAAKQIVPKTELKDMLPSTDPKVQAYEEISDAFSGGAFVFITVEGTNKARMAQAAEEFVKETKQRTNIMKYVKAINLKLDREFVTKWGFMFSKAKDLKTTRKTFSKLNLLPFITALNNQFEDVYTGDDAEEDIETRKQENEAVGMLGQMETFFTRLRQYFDNKSGLSSKEQGKKLAETFLYGDEYNYAYDNSMLMFSITPNFTSIEFDACVKLTDRLKEVIKVIQKDFPDTHISYTGDVAIQADEQEALGFDMMVPALVAMGIILILFIFTYDQIRVIIFALISLVFGIVFNYGLVGVTLKEINMMTSIMAVLLLGLGIDYGIQVITNFLTYRRDGLEPKEAMTKTYIRAGIGTLLAALTTSIGFFVLSATGTKAFSQFGIVMGMGIITCFLAMIFILPSMLLWFGKKAQPKKSAKKLNYDFLPRLGKYIHNNKKRTLIVAAIVTGLLFGATFLNRFEYDLMKLEPQDMTSIIMYEKIMDKYGLNPFTAMVITESIEEAREITDGLEEESSVADINSIAYFIPTDKEQKARLKEIGNLNSMPERYEPTQYTAADIKKLIDELQRLEYNIIEMGDLAVAGLGEDNKIIKKRHLMIREIFGAEVGKPGNEVFQRLIKQLKQNPNLYAKRLTAMDASFAAEMDRIISKMANVNRKITIADLPKEISKTLLDSELKRNLITIYPKEWVLDNVKTMERFNIKLARISEKITGMTQIVTTMMDEYSSGSKKAGVFIFAVVFLFMLVTFRSLRNAVYASVPLVIGMIWMLGIYPLVGLKLNIINFALIPLVIGMGIDFGIHIVHRYTVEKDIEVVYRYTGKAVFLSAMTTMVGFGSLGLIGSFGSIASMGSLLFFGIAMCLASTIIILPALLGAKK